MESCKEPKRRIGDRHYKNCINTNESVTGSASMQDALDNGWKPHPERTNQSTGSESWSQNGNVRFKRRQLGNRDGY